MTKKFDKWLIWSNEHNAWWAPNHRGYVLDAKDAGRYTYEQAVKIVEDANIALKNEWSQCPTEAMVPDILPEATKETKEKYCSQCMSHKCQQL